MTTNTAVPGGAVQQVDCAFHATLPGGRRPYQHVTNGGVRLVPRIVALMTPAGHFQGDGVEVWVCQSCADVLDARYKAIAPGPVGGE